MGREEKKKKKKEPENNTAHTLVHNTKSIQMIMYAC